VFQEEGLDFVGKERLAPAQRQQQQQYEKEWPLRQKRFDWWYDFSF